MSGGRARPPAPATIELEPRFEVVGELGHGALSRVLEVYDRAQDVQRAFKLASAKKHERRLRDEFRLLTQLRHPNIVRAYDYGVSRDGTAYYTMELVRGVPFAELGNRGDPEVLASIAIQILDALSTIHARGYVHRDITPNNILVVGEGAAAFARLIDFGLVVPTEKRSAAAGTLPYMAPEVARGDAVDARADLYSLGMLLYEALLPAEISRTVEDVAMQMQRRARPPHEIDPTIPTGLSAVIVQLIEPEPSARFLSASAAADALADIASLGVGRGPPRAWAERLMRGGAVAHRKTLMRRLRQQAIDIRDTGRGRALLLGGPVGVGKTPVLRELGSVASLEGFRVLRLRASNHPGSPVPALLQAARALSPELVDSLQPATAEGGDVAAFAGRTAEIIAMALGDAPTALLIDDLHRAEPVALEVLRDLAEAVSGGALLLVLSGDPVPESPTWQEVFADAAETVELAPLSRGEVAALVAHRLAGLDLPAPALTRLTNDSAGMPSLVERTLARLIVERTIQLGPRGWVFVGGKYLAARHGDPDLVESRLEHVPEALFQTLWAAAVLGHGLSAHRVAHVVGDKIEATQQALAELSRKNLLNPGEASGEPTYIFVSRSLRAAVYQRIPGEVRRGLHDRAADLLAGEGGQTRRAEERVEHLLRGGDDERAVEAAVAAGDRAAAVFADRRAIDYYARAYARLGGQAGAAAASLALRLGRVFERIGELERALVWYQTAESSAAAADVRTRVEALIGIGVVHLSRGELLQAEVCGVQAEERLGVTADQALRGAAVRLQGLVALQRGEASQAQAMLGTALSAFEAAGAAQQTIDVLLDLARVAKKRGAVGNSVRYARRALALARTRGQTGAVAQAYVDLGRGFLKAGRGDAARRAMSAALKAARSGNDRLREATIVREIGTLRLRQGDLQVALDRYQRSLELARGARSKVDESAALHNIGLTSRSLGDYRGALSAQRAAMDVANAVGDRQAVVMTLVEMAHTYLGMGDHTQTLRCIDDAYRLGVGLDDPGILGEGAALEAWTRLAGGDTATAQRFVDSLDTRVAELEDPADRAFYLLYGGRCALELGDRGTAERLADWLGREIGEQILGDYVAPYHDLRGRIAAVQGDSAAARLELEKAARAAQTSGMRPQELRSRATLGELRQGTDAGAEDLTRAMEILRAIAKDTPPEWLEVLLGNPTTLRLREAFGREHRRLLNVAS